MRIINVHLDPFTTKTTLLMLLPVRLASESSSGSSGTERAAAREEPSEQMGKLMGVSWLENHLLLSPITPGSMMLVWMRLNVMLVGDRLHSQKYSTA